MGQSAFRNWHIQAYLEGRTDEIPADILPVVRDVAEKRKAYRQAVTDVPADASDEHAKLPAGWSEVD